MLYQQRLGAPQAPDEGSQNAQNDLYVAREQAIKSLTTYHQHSAVAQCPDRCPTRRLLEQGHLTLHLARTAPAHHDFVLARFLRYFELTVHDDVYTISHAPFFDQGLPRRDAKRLGYLAQLAQVLVSEPREDGYLAQELCCHYISPKVRGAK